MAEFPYMPFFTTSWVADTGHLSRIERGLYMDLLVLCWHSPDCRVPNEIPWISRKLQCSPEEVTILERIVAEFMQSTGNYLFQKRLRKEHEFVKDRTKKQSVRAKSRWNKDKNISHGNADTQGSGNAPTLTSTSTPTLTPKAASQQPRANGNTHDPFEIVAQSLREIPGINDHPVAVSPSIAPIWNLVTAGHDLKTQIIPSIQDTLRKTKKKINGWSYFAKVFVENLNEQQAISAPPVQHRDEATWLKLLEWNRRKKVWDPKTQGPLPHSPGCRVPAHLLEPDDGAGWADFKDYRP